MWYGAGRTRITSRVAGHRQSESAPILPTDDRQRGVVPWVMRVRRKRSDTLNGPRNEQQGNSPRTRTEVLQ
jgi:hypothetical protein